MKGIFRRGFLKRALSRKKDEATSDSVIGSQSDDAGNTPKGGSKIVRALKSRVTRAVLSATGTVAEAIPIVGPPIKAVIELLHKALEAIDARDNNKGLADKLIENLRELDERIVATEKTSDNRDGQSTPHLDRLRQQLDDLHGLLLGTRDSLTFFNSSAVGDRLKECAESIDYYLKSYTLSAIMSVDNKMDIMLSGVTIRDPSLQCLLRTDLQNYSIHSPAQATMIFFDPRDKRVDIPLHMCSSFEDFEAFISIYYKVHTRSPIRGGEYVKRGDYFLAFMGNEFFPRGDAREISWTNIVDKRGPLEMGVVILRVEPQTESLTLTDRCIRCNSYVPPRSRTAAANGDREFVCPHCDLKLYPPELTQGNDESLNEEATQNDINYFTNMKLRNIRFPTPQQPEIGSFKQWKMALNNYQQFRGLHGLTYQNLRLRSSHDGYWVSIVNVKRRFFEGKPHQTKSAAENDAAGLRYVLWTSITIMPFSIDNYI